MARLSPSTASRRNVKPRVKIDVVDPDLVLSTFDASGENEFSRSDQLGNKELDLAKYMTLELNRTVLDGTFKGLPDTAAEIEDEIGYVGDVVSDGNGEFTDSWISREISGASILQAMGIAFSSNIEDGYGVDFTVEIYSGVTLAYTKEFTGNTKTLVTFDRFTVYSPTKVKIIFEKWSLPGRFVRVADVIYGSYELWDGNTIYYLDVQRQADFTCMSLPYGTATLKIDNSDKRFDPNDKSSIFKSLESRQPFELFFNVNGEIVPSGKYYLVPDGWTTEQDNLLLSMNLTDIKGLIRDRKFIAPNPLPTTLEGWVAAIVAQLGTAFENCCRVDTSIASMSMTCTAEDVARVNCGDLLRWVCMFAEAYPGVDAETGCIVVEPISNLVKGDVTLDNTEKKPVQVANDDIALIVFRLNDAGKTEHIINGTSQTATKTLSISNPFIKDTTNASRVARFILSLYGGRKTEITGRGDPYVNIGDALTVELTKDTTAGGRLMKQQLKVDNNGIMRAVRSTVLQPSGGLLFKDYMLVTESGDVQMPNVDTVTAIWIGGGDGGENGQHGNDGGAGGDGGKGGKILIADISITPESVMPVVIGAGGPLGLPGTETTFAGFSSADGETLNGWADAFTGKTYGRNGVDGVDKSPTIINGTSGASGTGNGGGGGSGGKPAVYVMTGWYGYSEMVYVPGQGWVSKGYTMPYYDMVSPDIAPGLAAPGGSGAVIILYDRE